jgi:cell wall-associated NlpC family hydrolase
MGRIAPVAAALATLTFGAPAPAAASAAGPTAAATDGRITPITCQLSRPTCPENPAPAGRWSPGVSSRALAFARSQVGKGYRFGGSGPRAYDCSGLVWRSYYQAGLRLRRGTAAALFEATGQRVSRGQSQPGDLLFWSGNGRRSGIYHVAFYLGAGRIIEAANPRAGVRITRIWRPRQVLPVALRLAG